jgi:transposase
VIINSEFITSLYSLGVPKDIKHENRAHIVALSRNGIDAKVIAGFIQCTVEMVQRWQSRCEIIDKVRCGRPLVYNQEIQLKLIAFYCQTTPLPGCGRWTLRWAEKHQPDYFKLDGKPISHSSIGRILHRHHLKPHLTKYFLQITDPNFFPKMEHIISLYLTQPEYLYCFDECPGIQVLQRLSPHLQTEEMKKNLEEFEYIRNGTIDVFAFLRVKSGDVFAECKSDHTTKTLLDVFEAHLKLLPGNESIHYIMDNLASHASYALCELVAKYSKINCPEEKELDTAPKRREWLQSESKRIIFHYTPFHGSWLNMVEIWFGILNQKCLKESYTSPESMHHAIQAFINEWNAYLAHPFKWNYDGEGLHQKVVLRFVRMLENSAEKLDIKFMTKQLLLMENIIEVYWDKVGLDIWLKLDNAIAINRDHLNEIISMDDGPKRMEKAKAALSMLIDSLRKYIGNTHEMVA